VDLWKIKYNLGHILNKFGDALAEVLVLHLFLRNQLLKVPYEMPVNFLDFSIKNFAKQAEEY